MAGEGTANRFGFEDPTYGFMGDRTAVTDASADPSLTEADPNRQQFYPPSTSTWDFQATPAYDNINIGTSAAPTTQPGVSAAGWSLPVFDQSQDGTFNFDGFSPSDVNSNIIFGASNTEALNTRQPAAIPMSPALQQKLRNIAMPPHLQYNSPKSASSPDSANSEHRAANASSPEQNDPSKGDSRKRKVTSDPEDDDDVDDDDKPVKKTAHNMIEKRYRTNINDKIAALRDSVPSLRIMCKSARGEDTTEDREELHGLTPAHKLNKATVLSKATEYIRHLEKRNNRLLEENGAMSARIAAFEKLFMAGAMNGSISPMQHPPTPMQYAQDNPQQFNSSPMGTPQPNANPASSGMIQVPDDMKRIISAQMAVGQPYPVPPQQSFRGANPAIIRQQQIQQQQQQAQQNGFFQGNPYFGKLMVGSLAGLMIIEAMRESETSTETTQGRGLFALPVQLLGSLASSLDVHIMGYHALSSLKTLLLLGTFLWIFVPSLFASREPKSKKLGASMLRKAPSLASSIQIRRQAWLTSIQTVWVPRHNFFLEAAALILKTMKLSLRNVFGTHGFQILTGMTQEQEVARVKAWSIALDSQLAGGDVDVCKSRLVLTLLASGTLPDTPMRLMQKALHIRVLLWRMTGSAVVQSGTNAIAAKLARSRWNEARQLNQFLIQLRRGASVQHDDELPEHLVALVEQDCDDVLSRQVIQRAHNLAFNMDTTHNVTEPIGSMDNVVDDVAIGSPMDAVAAWWSTELLHHVFTDTLDKDSQPQRDVAEDIEIAIKVSPIGSYAKMRAILARAVLVKKSRGAHIAAALHALKSDQITSPFAKSGLVIGHGFDDFAPDLNIALRCAMAIAHLTRVANTPNATLANVESLNSIVRPENTSCMSLLGFTSVMELMDHLLQHKKSDQNIEFILERLAATLRLWVGGQYASRCGIDSQLRQQVVERCLGVTKSLVGMEIDTGYGSMSEDETVQE